MVSCSECHIFGLALFGIVKVFTIHVILYLLNFVFSEDSTIYIYFLMKKIHDLCSYLCQCLPYSAVA
jgi:hypothetical protein